MTSGNSGASKFGVKVTLIFYNMHSNIQEFGSICS